MKTISELGPREAARVLGIRLDALYPLIWCGKLAAEKRDGRWFVRKSAVDARLKQRERQREHRITHS